MGSAVRWSVVGLALACWILPGIARAPTAGAPQDPEIVLPAGTVIPIALSAFINSRSARVGDRFYADTIYPIWLQQQLIIPRGSTVRGTVTDVVRPGRVKGKGRLALRIDDIILPNGITRTLNASFRSIRGGGAEIFDPAKESVEADSSKAADVGTVARTTTQGAVVGGLIDRGTGAAIGAGVGGVAGLATVMLSRGQELVLPPGTQFDIELKQPLPFARGELDSHPPRYGGPPRTP